MRYAYVTADVFTDRTFGGNPLAVLTDARGLSTTQMQAIAREFNYAETTFVLPPEAPGTVRRVRIFTPVAELPFAGHPNIGTAVVLARSGILGTVGEGSRIVFDELAGPVPITLLAEDGVVVGAELSVPKIEGVGGEVAAEALAPLLGLQPGQIATRRHRPRLSTSGLTFLMAELTDLQVLAAAAVVDLRALVALEEAEGFKGLFLYTTAGDEGSDYRARMFAPSMGVPEDPVTGSANAAFGQLLATLDESDAHRLQWVVKQGVEMGRPGRVEIAVERTAGRISAIHVAGRAVEVCRGEIEVPDE